MRRSIIMLVIITVILSLMSGCISKTSNNKSDNKDEYGDGDSIENSDTGVSQEHTQIQKIVPIYDNIVDESNK